MYAAHVVGYSKLPRLGLPRHTKCGIALGGALIL